MAGEDIEKIIMQGVVFKGKSTKKKTYITGAHKSASAKMKADIRKRRANRPSQRKGQ